MHNLHSLPFHIDYDGPALVSKGFPVSAVDSDASASSSSLSKYSASFRGRRLTGTARQLPADLKSKLKITARALFTMAIY